MERIRVGIVGTGYVSKHFFLVAQHYADLEVTGVLTRRSPEHCISHPAHALITTSSEKLLDCCDVVFECSGDPIYATDLVAAACQAGRPVVTMNSEFHVTTGSYFVGKGLITESEGDQPGSLAALHERAVEMGFRPLAYANLKAYLNHTPTRKDMEYWAKRNHITLDKVISFTDGTKLQVEQALVANHFQATVARPGMIGLQMEDVDEGGRLLGERAKQIGQPIADYLLFPGAPHGVMIVAEHDDAQQDFLRHMKMGDGPFYVLNRNDVLVHLEVPRTIRRLVHRKEILLDNSATPTLNVAAVAKRPLRPGAHIRNGIGSFDVRGEIVKIDEHPSSLPIGLLVNATLTRAVAPGEYIQLTDVDLPDTLALRAWQDIQQRVVSQQRLPADGVGSPRGENSAPHKITVS